MTYFKNAAAVCALALSAGLSFAPDRADAGVSPYLGDIMIVGFNFCPRSWLPANGQLLQISSNQALFSLLGTTYGGDGRVTFALPDLRGRVTMGQGSGQGLSPRGSGQQGGLSTKIMSQANMPTHTHAVNANNLDGDKPGPGGKLLAAAPTGGTGNETIYSLAAPNVTMNPAMLSTEGASAAITTQDPYLAVQHCIATQGQFPSRS